MAVDVEGAQLEGAPFGVLEGNGVQQRRPEGGRNGPNPLVEGVGEDVDEGHRQELRDVVLRVICRKAALRAGFRLRSDLATPRRSRS